MINVLARALDIAKELIAIPGYSELPEKESLVARKLCDILVANGVDAEMVEAAPGRYNVVAVYKGTGEGKNLLLCTHLDTVPAYEMPNAFVPEVRDGRLYGRGAVDVKDILGAMATVMITLAKEKPVLAGDVIFLGVADEESGSIGMRGAVSDPRVCSADFAVIGEPTELHVGVAHKGVEWFEAVFHGKATHGGTPEKGINAVYHATAVVDHMMRNLIPLLDARTHPLLGRATMNVGYFHGGTRPTIVPEECTVRWDRRILPSEPYEMVKEEFRRQLETVKQSMPQMDYEYRTILGDSDRRFPPLSTEPNDAAVVCAMDVVRRVTGQEPAIVGLPFWTDAALFPDHCGGPAIVLGPGNIAQAHSNCEYVPLNELEAAVRIYYELALAYCGKA